MAATQSIDTYIADLNDWRGEQIAHFRALIHEVYPEIKEEWKWDVPVFVASKMVMAMSAFNDHIKINFFKGALLPDAHNLFNSGLDSKSHRSINMAEHKVIDEVALRQLILAAIEVDKKK
jgi:hypothetical protein